MKKIIVFFLSLFAQHVNGSKHFVLIAAPGSGKGTFSQYLKEKYGYLQICPGDIYRNEVKNKTKMGLQIERIVENGDYVDEEKTCALISQYVEAALDQNKFFIIDGFPRTEYSFQFLDDLFKQKGLVDSVCFVQLLASDESCFSRIFDRQVCTECFKVYNSSSCPSLDGFACDDCGTVLTRRKADTDQIVLKRLDFFHAHIEPLMKMASEIYKTKNINTQDSIENLLEVYDDLVTQ